MKRIIATLVITACLKTQEAVPVVPGDFALQYLTRFGYSSQDLTNENNVTVEAVSEAVSGFQSFTGLNVTGTLNDDARKFMSSPRCGVKDIVESRFYGPSNFHLLRGTPWLVKNITYKISRYSRILDKTIVEREIARALAVWSNCTDLTFTQKGFGSVHIDIRFEEGEHGDGDPFDGPGHILGHANFPIYGGHVHFDDSEYWTVSGNLGTNLFQVAVHEFGHSLGLDHSRMKSAIMAPRYTGYDPNFILDKDDIQRIQAIYGPKNAPSKDLSKTDHQPVRRPLVGRKKLDLCAHPEFDTMFQSAEGHIYVFRNIYYWRLESQCNGKWSVARGYPKYIDLSWRGLPGDIDAAFTYKDGRTYFFKGSKFWRYEGKKMDGNFPKEIKEGFPGIPWNSIHAVVYSKTSGKVTFYQDKEFWEFDPLQHPQNGGSKSLVPEKWEDIVAQLWLFELKKTVLILNGTLFFFTGQSYMKYRGSFHGWTPTDFFGCQKYYRVDGEMRWKRPHPQVSGNPKEIDDSSRYDDVNDISNTDDPCTRFSQHRPTISSGH